LQEIGACQEIKDWIVLKSNARRSKKLLPRHFHYPPPDGLRPAQITATIAAFSWPRTNPFAAYPFTVTRANHRTDLLLPVGQPPAFVV
jgi:hypothetical protein